MKHSLNKNTDEFSKIVQQKLKNHQLAVDPESWNAIARQLNTGRSINPKWLLLAISSAAVLALVFIVQIFHPTNENIADSRLRIENLQTSIVKPSTSISLKTSSAKKNNLNIALQPKKTVKNISITAVNKDLPEFRINATDSTTVETEMQTATLRNDQLIIAQKSDKDSAIEVKAAPKVYLSLKTEEPMMDMPPEKSTNKWMLAATYGSQGNPQFGASRDLLASELGNNVLSTVDTKYSSIMTPNDFESKSYFDPVSVGITVRRKLNKTFSIETGVVYTYLLSVFENNGLQRSDAKLHLHYIGVPVSFIAKFWENRNWELYSTLGVLPEKGVQSVYVQNIYNFNQTSTTTAKNTIDGIQWSLNGGFGLGYKLHRRIGIYFEPKFSHYFENNQPVSIRTDHPFVFGLNVGLRVLI